MRLVTYPCGVSHDDPMPCGGGTLCIECHKNIKATEEERRAHRLMMARSSIEDLMKLLRRCNLENNLDRCDDFPMDCERCLIGPENCTPLAVRAMLEDR